MFEKWVPSLKKKHTEPSIRRPSDIWDLMDQMWDARLESMMGHPGGFPSIDLSETETEVVVKAEVPGLDPKDMELTFENDMLVLRGEKRQEKEEKGESYHRVERSYGSFSRAIPLPCKCDPDKVSAKYKKGILTVRIEKDKSVQAKRVAIES